MAEKSGRGDESGKLPEPVVRPRGMRPHGVQAVRRARLYSDGAALVLRDRGLSEHRYPVSSGGIRRAVFSPPSADLWVAGSGRPVERWGVLAFQEEDGQPILEVPLADWLPEANVVGTLDLRPEKCLD